MNYFIFIVIFTIGTILTISGCSNDPGELGLGLVSPDDTLRIFQYETRATDDTTFLYRISGSSSTLVGKYLDPVSNTSIEARALLQFSGFTNIPDSAIIDTAYISLKLNYRFKDPNGSIYFSIHQMDTTWNAGTYKWDSLLTTSYIPTADTVFEKIITADDSVTHVRVDPLVRKWVKEKTNAPNGMIFIPGLTGSDLIIGSRSTSSIDGRPYLTVKYHTAGDTMKTFSTKAIQSSFVADGTIPSDASSTYIQGGIGFRSLLRFDSLNIPKRVSITRAILELSIDTDKSLLNSYSNDSLLVYFVRKNSLPYDSLVLGTLCSPAMNGNQKIFRADIKTLIQQWIIREPNYGLIIKPYGEYNSFDRLAIYSASARINLRPKLSIIYTALP